MTEANYPEDRLYQKQTGSRRAYFLDGRMVRKGAQLEMYNGMGGWISGRFEGNAESNVPPTLLCSSVNPHDEMTAVMTVIRITADARVRWPKLRF